MSQVGMHEAKTKLSQLVERAQAGEDVVITRNGKPVADVVPHRPAKGLNWEAIEEWKRELGVDSLVTYIAPDFDDPLPEDFLSTPGPH